MSIETHLWINCDHPTCDARTPDHVDRLEARRWAAEHGWGHRHPNMDRCPLHAGKEPVPALQPPKGTGSILEDGEGYWSEDARKARLEAALDRIMR